MAALLGEPAIPPPPPPSSVPPSSGATIAAYLFESLQEVGTLALGQLRELSLKV
eukprot:COSAG05_NODE_421_length_9965_cov_60.769207_7_plen_54_part_00